MDKKYLALFSLLYVLTTLSTNVSAKSSVWKISQGDKYFYLGGTIHLLKPDDHPLPEEFTRAYQDSSQLIFETDIAETQSSTAQQKFLSVMIDGSGKTLESNLNKKTYKQLQSFLASRNIPIEGFAVFRPWALAITLTLLEYQRLGMMPEYGVEEHFNRLAIKDGKTLSSLESVDEQISFLQSMDNIEPNIMVGYTLRDLAELPDFVTSMKSNWLKGDIETFSNDTMIVQMQNEFPELYHTLLTNRNNNWMKDITALNNNDIIEFVLVGALHLSGKKGLLNQLREAGFKVTQL